MSETEREALTAGTVGWEGEMFSGMPDWDKLRAIPAATLSAEEVAFLEGPVEALCALINNWEINQLMFEVPKIIWDHLKEYGFFGLIIPKKRRGERVFCISAFANYFKNIRC